MTAIGKSVPRVDAHGKVTGETLFPGDISSRPPNAPPIAG